MLRLALAGLPRILAEPDPDLFAVPRSCIEQQSFDIARVGPHAHQIEQPISTILVAAELDADCPVEIVELGLLGRCEIPITHDLQIRRSMLDDRAPFAFEIEPGGWPDLPVAPE